MAKFLTSIRFQLIAVFSILLGIVCVVVLFMVSRIMSDTLLSSKILTLQNSLNKVAIELPERVVNNDLEGIYETFREFGVENKVRLLVLDKNYIVRADSASLYNGYYLPYAEAQKVVKGETNEALGFHKLNNIHDNTEEWVAYFAKPLTYNGSFIGVLMCSASINDTYQSVASVQNRIAGVFWLVLLASVIVWLAFSNELTKPVINLTNVLRQTTTKNYPTNLNIKGTGEVKELVEAYNRMSQELFEYNKVRDEFVANASHELKTPLTAIKILSEAILSLDNPLAHPERMLEFMKDIDAEVDRLNHIITRLLEIARENEANIDMELKYFDLGKLVDVIAHRLAPIAMQKKLTLKISIDRDIQIFADEHRIDRAITNLIDNAIKYTDEGSVEVDVRHNSKYAIVRVRDTGIGIPESARAHVFDRFYRVDKARSRAKGGTGLGLSLVNDIVKAHGGYITLDSEIGVGSMFTVYLPLTK